MSETDDDAKKMNEGAWVITGAREDFDLKSRIGWTGPRGTTMTKDEIAGSPDSHEFRMFEDGETEPDYTGKCYLPFGMTEAAFNPLDNLGAPDTGCVLIEYLDKETGKWEML